MEKVSIGLRGWRFDESEVFTDNGEYRPLDEMSKDTRKRLVRLSAIHDQPCHACWLIHGDENIEECNKAEIVYGEPLAEVLLCEEHSDDFAYWYFEEEGNQYRGEDEFQDKFHAWFADGNRAPEGYEGIQYKTTNQNETPQPQVPDPEKLNIELSESEQTEFDLRELMDEDYTDL